MKTIHRQKLRAELDKARMKRAEADAKVKHLEQKLREAENSQILAEVGALKLTPEQLAEFLKMAAGNRVATVSQGIVIKRYSIRLRITKEGLCFQSLAVIL